MLEEILRSGFTELSLPLDESALERYRIYADALEEANRVMNLTAIEGEDETARLHFLDSAALLSLADFRGRRVIDVGTGAGFPGLALKIAEPSIDLVLLDSLDKRIGFLRECCEKLGFDDVACVHARAEETPKAWRGGLRQRVGKLLPLHGRQGGRQLPRYGGYFRLGLRRRAGQRRAAGAGGGTRCELHL